MHISLLQICCNLSIILYFFLVCIPIIHIQWGNYEESQNENDVRAYPIAFNTTCLCCIAVANFNKSDSILSRYPNRPYWAAPVNNIQFICGMEPDFDTGNLNQYLVKVISIGW